MALYSGNTLTRLRGRVKSVKPNASVENIEDALNSKVRDLYDRHWWSDSLRTGIIPIYAGYTTGTVTPTSGSQFITGTATAWPVNDAVNTVIPSPGIVELGPQEVTPGSMTKIGVGTYLLVDQEHPSVTEVTVVTDTTPTTFTASFKYQHDPATTLQSSSLAGRQFKAQYPVYTVRSVRSATSLELDNIWVGAAVSNIAYWIFTDYVSVTPYTRRLMYVWDPVQGCPVEIWHTQEDLSIVDPQRTSSDNPNWLVQATPSEAGVAMWEVWPAILVDYSLSVVSQEQWPELTKDTDTLPPFFNPDVIVDGAIAEVLRIRNISREGRTDPYFDPQLAAVYDGKFEAGYERMRQADEGRSSTLLTTYIKQLVGGMSDSYDRSHAVTADGMDYGGPGGGW